MSLSPPLWLVLLSSGWFSSPLVGSPLLVGSPRLWLVLLSSGWFSSPLVGSPLLWLVLLSWLALLASGRRSSGRCSSAEVESRVDPEVLTSHGLCSGCRSFSVLE
uniref:Secreted protein n=1 Tax=Knipowitschia caucasica TaxID=637954 RepID=A0AAV2KP21_KNICA